MSAPADSASLVLIAYLIGAGVLDDPAGSSPSWPVFRNHEPPKPDNCVTIKDAVGGIDARTLDGEVFEREGVQVRVRALDDQAGWAKARAIAAQLKRLGDTITVGSVTYTLQNVNQEGSPFFLGLDGATRRFLWTINYQVLLG